MLLTAPTHPRRRNLDPVDYSKSLDFMKQYERLTRREQVLHDCLLKVVSDTVPGNAIVYMFANYSNEYFRELVLELLSQAHDNPDMMYRILGKEAYDALLNVRP